MNKKNMTEKQQSELEKILLAEKSRAIPQTAPITPLLISNKYSAGKVQSEQNAGAPHPLGCAFNHWVKFYTFHRHPNPQQEALNLVAEIEAEVQFARIDN